MGKVQGHHHIKRCRKRSTAFPFNWLEELTGTTNKNVRGMLDPSQRWETPAFCTRTFGRSGTTELLHAEKTFETAYGGALPTKEALYLEDSNTTMEDKEFYFTLVNPMDPNPHPRFKAHKHLKPNHDEVDLVHMKRAKE